MACTEHSDPITIASAEHAHYHTLILLPDRHTKTARRPESPAAELSHDPDLTQQANAGTTIKVT